MSTLPEKLPPQNLQAEMSLLGSILISKDSIVKIVDMINAEDFYSRAHSDIFTTMMELYAKNEPIDVLTLGNRLKEKGLLEKMGGNSFIVKMSTAVPTAAHIKEYANIVKKKSIHRNLLRAAEKITAMGYNEEEDDIDSLLDEAQQEIYALTQNNSKSNFTPIKNVLSGAFERIDKLHKDGGKMRGVPSGFDDLDAITAGFQKSDLVILAARPSVGKTSFCLDLARHAASKNGVPVGFFSLEMSKEQLVDRMLCAEAGVNLSDMINGKLSDSRDFPKIGRAMGVLSEAPIFIDESPGTNVMQIRAKARRLKSEHGLGMIIIDYLQLLLTHSTRYAGNRVQEVSEMSRQLKHIARELEVPVIALSQLSRAVESVKPAVPKLSHLRESGSIEQDADVVLFLYRKAADRNYRLEDIPPDERNLGEVHIAKHRNGPTGMVRLFFDATRASYRNLDSYHSAPQAAGGFPPPAPPPYDSGVPSF